MSKDEKNRLKGFAGLEDLALDITDNKPATPPSSQPLTPARNTPPTKIVWSNPNERPTPISFEVNETVLNSKKPGQKHGEILWVIGIATVGFLFWLANSNNESVPNVASTPSSYQSLDKGDSTTMAPTPTYRPAAPSAVPPKEIPPYGNLIDLDAPPGRAAPAEEQPPYGNGLSFSRNQIRYCLSEKIRLEGWRSAVNDYSSSSLAAFNNGIDDYNQRCSHFRYRRGSLESVRSEVETRHDDLWQEGRAVAARNP